MNGRYASSHVLPALMARGPLNALLRLRGLRVTEAKLAMADCARAAAAAAQQAEQARQLVRVEGLARALDGSYATWLPRGMQAVSVAETRASAAEGAMQASRQALAATRSEERAVEAVIEAKAKEARKKAMRRAQAAMDEVALNRHR